MAASSVVGAESKSIESLLDSKTTKSMPSAIPVKSHETSADNIRIAKSDDSSSIYNDQVLEPDDTKPTLSKPLSIPKKDTTMDATMDDFGKVTSPSLPSTPSLSTGSTTSDDDIDSFKLDDHDVKEEQKPALPPRRNSTSNLPGLSEANLAQHNAEYSQFPRPAESAIGSPIEETTTTTTSPSNPKSTKEQQAYIAQLKNELKTAEGSYEHYKVQDSQLVTELELAEEALAKPGADKQKFTQEIEEIKAKRASLAPKLAAAKTKVDNHNAEIKQSNSALPLTARVGNHVKGNMGAYATGLSLLPMAAMIPGMFGGDKDSADDQQDPSQVSPGENGYGGDSSDSQVEGGVFTPSQLQAAGIPAGGYNPLQVLQQMNTSGGLTSGGAGTSPMIGMGNVVNNSTNPAAF